MIQIIKNNLYYLLVIILLFNFYNSNNASYLNVDEYNEMLLSGSSGVSSKASTTMYTVPPVDSTTSTTATIVSTTTMLPTTTTTTTMVPTTTATTTMTPTTISPTLSSTTAYSTGGITPSPTVTNETTISTGGSGTSSSTTGIPTTTPLPTTPASTFFISKNAFLVDRPTSFNITCSNKSINFVTHQIAVTATNIYKSFYLDCSVTREVDYATATCNFAQSVMGNQFINSGKLINIVTSTLNGTVPATTYQINSPFLAHNQYVNITGYGFTQISDPSVVSVKDRNGVVLSTQMFETYMLVNLFGLPGDTNGKFYVYIYGEQIIYYQFSTLTPYLTSVSNSILNINDQLTIKGTLFRVPTEAKVQIILNGAIVKIITYNYIDQNTITIPTIETSSLSGEALITFEQTISGSVGFNLPSNQISVSFALPNISNVVYNFNNNQLVVSGTFLNPQIGITYLNGIVYDSVAPDSITSTSSQLVYVNPKIFYGELYLSCYQTNSVLHSEFSVKITPTPLQLDKVPVRKSKTIYFSGQFLSPVDRDGNQLYKATISSTHTGTSVETIECKDFNAKYLGTKQLYNVSCTVDKYISNPTTFSVTLIVGTSITVPLPFSYAPPTITSVSSTVYGVPGQITISGTSFCSNAIISIGGVNCTNPSILPSTSTDILDKLVCSFSSNSGSGYTTNALPVSIACDDQVITLESSFLYSIDKPCPTSTNGLICSGSTNGECIATTKECKCNKGFGGFDCSIVIVDLVPPPTPKVTNNALTIIDSGSKNSGSGSDGSGSSNNNGGGNPNNNLEGQVRFDIGIIQIREIESYNNDKVVRYVDLKTQIWEQSTIVDDTTKTTSYLYNVTVVATNIQILIIVNSDQTIQHDFLGDTIELLPNSVKYELSITNWEFAAKLNTIQVLFESKVTNDCQQQDGSIISNNNKLLMNGESIRSIEMKTSSGKTLVGTFSNRMKVDDKTVVSKIEILSNEQLLASDIIVDTTNGGNSVIQAVSVGYFEQKTIIDPSFAVLVGSDNSNNGQLDICGNPIDNSPSKLANWKIAVAVVCSAVGVALIFVTTAVTYKKIRNKSLMLDIRLKLSRRG